MLLVFNIITEWIQVEFEQSSKHKQYFLFIFFTVREIDFQVASALLWESCATATF